MYELPLLTISHTFNCKNKNLVDDIQVYSNEYHTWTYNDFPYIYVSAYNSGWEDRITFQQANAYCSLNYDSTLATIKTDNEYDQVFNLIFPYMQQYIQNGQALEIFFPLIGLNNVNNNQYYSWIYDNSYYYNTLDIIQSQDGSNTQGECATLSFYEYFDSLFAQDPSLYVREFAEWPCTDRKTFVCDLYNITNENDRYIGVYLFGTYLTFDEANDWCNNTYGTELATILTQSQNINGTLTIFLIFVDFFFLFLFVFLCYNHQLNLKCIDAIVLIYKKQT